MPEVAFNIPELQQEQQPPLPQPPATLPHLIAPSNLMMPNIPHPMSFMFMDPNQGQAMQMQLPIIHRLIPNAGPTHGGIEVTILGANFHPTIQLNCVFGETTASSTQRWSDNTLVCMLPPRATPGVVAVWFEGFPKTDDQLNSPPSLFTYSDESDRALMELALQVVGLKMTGKIEDAKNVAMRIVGNAGTDGSDSSNTTNGMMQLASLPTSRDLRPLLIARADEGDNFESRIVDFLSVMDTPMGTSAPNALATKDAISYPCPSGQTLLHLAAFLGFASLTRFLIKHGADCDARDRNGFTPLHLAALSQSSSCASILVEAGADLEIVNALGKRPDEIAISGFFDGIIRQEDADSECSEDEDADFGDAEEDDDVELRRILSRRISRRSSRLNIHHSGRATPRRSVDISRAATPPPPPPVSDEKSKANMNKQVESDAADAKRAASFMDMIQRTLAQIPAPQGIIPNIPHLRHLPDLPAVPWGALPQIPMVFPVFVPMMPNWPSFLGGDHPAAAEGKMVGEGDEAARNMGAVALRAAQEWRATWEKWVALAVATTARQQTDDLPPPVYTPRAVEEESKTEVLGEVQESIELQEPVASTSSRPHADIRPVGYDSTPVPDQVVESFGYQPTKQSQKLQKKHDRMLLLFWLPILFASMVWAFHNGVRIAFQAVKMAVQTPLRT